MRYAIFSDVHANLQAWEAVRADALRQRVDTLICLGDVVGYGPKPLEVLTSVRESTPNFVLGNHDAAACGRLDASIFNPQARSVIEWTCERLDDDAREFLNRVPLQMNGEGIQLVHAEVGNLANDQWRHVVATIDRPSGTVHLYLDGKPVADRHIDFVGQSTITSKSGLAIGRDSDDKQRHRGKLDDVAIWRRTLAPEEVTRIFNSGKSLGSIFGAEAAE